MTDPQYKMKLLLPDGSLNDPKRGYTGKYFKGAFIFITGYEPKEEVSRPQVTNMYPVLGPDGPSLDLFKSRPEDIPRELTEWGNAGITGVDWVLERTLRGDAKGIELVGDLCYGGGDIVVAASNKAPFKTVAEFFAQLKGRDLSRQPVKVYSEYPNIARKFIADNKGYKAKFGETMPTIGEGDNGGNGLVRIIQSYGGTETGIDRGMDLIIDLTTTGNSLRKNNLKIVGKVLGTSAGLYAGPSCTDRMREDAKILYDLLLGAVLAADYCSVLIDTPVDQIAGVTAYLEQEHLFIDAPTTKMPIVEGEPAQINVIIPQDKFPGMTATLERKFEVQSVIGEEIKVMVRR